MHYFDRIYKLVIEAEKKIEIIENKISFEVTKSINHRENIGRIEIFNLSRETRKQLTAGNSHLRLFAGYKYADGLVEIANGDITDIRTARNRTEVITQIFIEEGKKTLSRTPVAISLKDKVTLDTIVNKLGDQTNLNFTFQGVNKDRSIDGYAGLGSIDVILNDLALIFGFKWSMCMGGVLISGDGLVENMKTSLPSPESGLILNPQSLKKQSLKLGEYEKPQKDIFMIQALLQPSLEVNGQVEIKSDDLDGQFRILKITHKGNDNDWYSNIEVSC